MRAEDIETEYQRRLAAQPDANWGWRFMYTREAALEFAKVVIVGLNPGGRQADPLPEWEFSRGNAYFDQPWGDDGRPNALQLQVESLRVALGVGKNEIFAANFIPFRSPSWNQLPDKEGALKFGRTLWTRLLARKRARLFVSLGKQSGQELARLLDAPHKCSYDVDWGSHVMDEYAAADGRTVLALPHLSRFRVFGGARRAAAMAVSGVARRVLG